MKFSTNSPTKLSQPVNLQPQRKPLVVFCVPGGQFSPAFFDSWTKMMLAAARGLPFDIMVSRHYSPVIFHCRANILGADNRAGKHQIPFQGKVKYDYLMWLDTDIQFEPEQVISLFKTMEKHKNIEVCGGIYLTTSGTHSTIVKDWDLDFFLKTGMFPFLSPQQLREIAAQSPMKLAEVFYAGMGFLMMKKGALEKITYPWFEPIMHEIEFSKDFSSEDVSMCWKLNEAGVKIYIDPSIIVGHEKSTIIRERMM